MIDRLRETREQRAQLRDRLHVHLHANRNPQFLRAPPRRKRARIVEPVLLRHGAAGGEETQARQARARPRGGYAAARPHSARRRKRRRRTGPGTPTPHPPRANCHSRSRLKPGRAPTAQRRPRPSPRSSGPGSQAGRAPSRRECRPAASADTAPRPAKSHADEYRRARSALCLVLPGPMSTGAGLSVKLQLFSSSAALPRTQS